jgi:hypothetical protein
LTFAEKIRAAYGRSVASIFEIGDLLIAARERLPHGEFEAMVNEDLPFGPSQARKYKKVAEDQRLRKRARVHALPAAMGTLFELSKCTDEELDRIDIRPALKRSEVEAIRRASRNLRSRKGRRGKDASAELRKALKSLLVTRHRWWHVKELQLVWDAIEKTARQHGVAR